MADILARILATKADEVAAAKRARPLAEIAAAARAQSPPRDFAAALRAKIAAGRAGRHRRDQEGEPEPRRAARRFRSAGDRGEL